MTTHITENSLHRIAGGAERNGSRKCACGAKPTLLSANSEPADGNFFIVVPGNESWPLENVGKVDCSKCRVLIDGALERKDVAALMRMVSP